MIVAIRKDRDLTREIEIDPEDVVKQLESTLSRARVDGSAVFLELLNERSLWNLANQVEQDLAIACASDCLGTSYQIQKIEIYECAQQQHRIATFIHIPSQVELNLIPGTTNFFSLRNQNAEPSTIKPMLVGVAPVSQRSWDLVGGSDYRELHGERRPIDNVSWESCSNWLQKCGNQLRMLSLSEWEYVCRAGATSSFYFGDDDRKLGEFAWYQDNSDHQTHPIQLKNPNAFGLFDLLGNVWEWVVDTNGSAHSEADTLLNLDFDRFTVGGCFEDSRSELANYPWDSSHSTEETGMIGFRICRNLKNQ